MLKSEKLEINSPMKQECIPVGCVPSAALAVSPGGGGSVCVCSRGGVSSQGVSALGGVCSGGYLLLKGVCSGGVCLLLGVSTPRGVSALGGVCSGGVPSAAGVCLLPGGCLLRGWGVVSQHALRQTPSPCGQTDACKNITFATSLRMVTINQRGP